MLLVQARSSDSFTLLVTVTRDISVTIVTTLFAQLEIWRSTKSVLSSGTRKALRHRQPGSNWHLASTVLV